jgi:hypothetical protein
MTRVGTFSETEEIGCNDGRASTILEDVVGGAGLAIGDWGFARAGGGEAKPARAGAGSARNPKHAKESKNNPKSNNVER